MNHARFGEIRSLLHSQLPSAQLWKKLTNLLWGWRNNLPQDAMTEYCNALLTSWPDELRELPKGWRRAMLRGQQEPIFGICRAAYLANRNLELDDLNTLMSCESLNKLTILDLSNNNFADYGSSNTAWVEMLERSVMLGSMRELKLRESNINSDTLEHLARVDLRHLTKLDLSLNIRMRGLPEWFEHALSPSRLERLTLHFVIDDNRRNQYEPGSNSALNPVNLYSEDLLAILRACPVDALDLKRCKCDPLVLMKNDMLANVSSLVCTPNEHQESWTRYWSEANLSGLRHLRLTSFHHEHGEGQLEAICRSVEQGRLELTRLDLPVYVIHGAMFTTHYVSRFEAHGVTLGGVELRETYI